MKIREPVQARSITTKKALFFAGLELFRVKPYHTVTCKEIANRANVAVGSYYSYYNDKKTLFIEAYIFNANEYSEHIRGLFSNLDFRSPEFGGELRKFLYGMLEAEVKYGAMDKDIKVIGFTNEELDRLESHSIGGGIGTALEALKSNSDNVQIKDIEVTAIFFYELTRGVMDSIINGKYEYPTERIVDGLCETIKRILGYEFSRN
jgi:hypothetical protein